MGMLVQCSIQESQLHNLTESPLRALQGNQVAASGSYKMSYLDKNGCGIMGNAGQEGSTIEDAAAWENGTADGLYATNHDLITTRNAMFLRRDDVYAWPRPGGVSYTGASSVDTAHNCPLTSGYPEYVLTDGSGDPYLYGVGYQWGRIPPPVDSYSSFSGGTPGFESSNTVGYFIVSDGSGSYQISLTSTLSDPCDFTGDYSTAKADLLSQAWNWSVSEFSLRYNEPDVSSFSNDISALNPADYDLSLISGSGVGGHWLSLTTFPCSNGWYNTLPSGMRLGVGLAKNTTGAPQIYFIGHYRLCERVWNSMVFGSGTAHFIEPGITTTLYELTLVSVGTIENGKIIGRGQDIDLPFPDSSPFPLPELGNNTLIADVYFAVIGTDPSSWASANSLSFGTSTVVSS